tara:strand:- start:6 stop:1937 length:1932 start_codon:yes stop_codon:yes gene_type:complete
MSTTVDQLIVEIRAETAGLRKGLDDVNRKLGTANKTARGSIMNFGNLAKVFATVGIAKLGSQVISTTRTFEDLNATLRAITGSAAAADASFAMIRKFTSTTTFQLENVTEGFISLFNAGIAPTEERMRNFGNVAAAFNKDITQITRAIFNATTGEMEMLKQFGIKAKQNTDSIDVTFAGATTRIDKTSDAIVEFVENIGRVKFSTALEERALTLSGAISNMQDSFSEFFFAIGEGGFKEVMTELALSTKAMLDASRPLARAVGGTLKKAFDGMKGALEVLRQNFEKLIVVTLVYTSLAVGPMFVRAGLAALAMATSVKKLRLAMLSLNKASKKNILILGGLLLAEATGLLDVAMEQISPKLKEFGDGLSDLMGIDDTDTGESAEKNRIELERLLDTMENGTVTAEGFKTILDLATGSIGQLGLIYKGLNSQVADGSMTFDEANATLREFLRTTGPTGEAMAQIGEEVEGLASSFSDDLTSALMEGENGLESFKNFAKNIVSAVISAFMELLVIQPIIDAILGMFQISAPKGGVKPSTTTSTGKPKAGGGTIQAGIPSLVGERGPEIFVPNTGGTIMNNMNSKNAMGGGGTTIINQSINFATGVVPTVRAEVMKMMPQIANVTKGAVAEAAMRGGNYRRALQGG